MPIFMDDINVTGKAEDVRKGIQNCRQMEMKKKFTYGLKKTKYMVIGKGKPESIEEEVEAGEVERTITYK